MALEEGEYRPRQYATTGGLAEVDFRSMARSHDKSAIPNRDPTHPSGGKRKRGDEARARRARAGRADGSLIAQMRGRAGWRGGGHGGGRGRAGAGGGRG